MTNRRSFLIGSTALLATIAAPSLSFAGGHGRIGEFTGKSKHVTKGRAEVVTKNGKSQVILLDDFWFDGAPDPKVAFGRNGYDKNTLMGKLKANTGKQTFDVPAGVDAATYNEVWIWCEKFNVPLGVAKLN
ncbi:DM13 domain-containing protein [Tateyamaria omphalii]|uniref:DM13 domain-containing protein n=1 Tax=Tateyamaria omphalii TaxID=299262 RepID=UPI001C99C01C|nr:DM13 domain-containing protein [Tateyamaria omphalii]MBY5933415.1 DM13 domain-containing protein [Tateyamaria omphalii]